MERPVKNKKSKSGDKKVSAAISSKVGNYEKHPFFVKKAKEAKVLIESVGLPKFS